MEILPIVSSIQITKVTRALTATVLTFAICLSFDKLFATPLLLVGSTWLQENINYKFIEPYIEYIGF